MTERGRNTRKNLKEGGVTLIALVITIIVLLILAGVALATLTGDSGILSNSEKAKEQTKIANTIEKIKLSVQGAMAKGLGTIKEPKQLTDELDNIVGDYEIEPKKGGWIVDVDDTEIWVSDKGNVVEGKTLGSIYTEDMIGKTINYVTTNNLSSDVEWIIIGQDEKGNVLATTSRPIGSADGESADRFTTTNNAEGWLVYEEELNTHCKEKFSGEVQGKTIEARSMTIEDANMVTGFKEPEFNTYTFKNQENTDFVNKVVNYYHPDITSANKWSKETKKYECDAYFYATRDSGIIWYGEATNWEEVAYTEELNNLELIVGASSSYLLASRSVAVYEFDDLASFGYGIVQPARTCWIYLEFWKYII